MIELRNVAFRYASRDVFSEVSLALEPGSFHFLTGPSGVGKTTLLKLCYGALTPSEGDVLAFGDSLGGLDRDGVALARRRIGVVHQDGQFIDHLPLSENVALPLTVSGIAGEYADNLADLMKWVGLTDQADQLPPSLSGGERQRAALARAVIMSPDVVLADEPTGNVDWEMSQRLIKLLVELHKMGKSILICTHDLNLVRATKALVPARVLRLKDQRLIAAGADL